MKFGPVATREAEGAILAHATDAGARRLKKGTVLSAHDCAALAAAGHASIVAARLEAGDVHEDAAASELATALAGGAGPEHIRIDPAFTGRVNIYAAARGLFVADAQAIARANAIDEAITIATLPAHTRVEPGRMLATVKMIPFAVERAALDAVCAVAAGAIHLAPFAPLRAGLVATELPGLKASVMDKTARLLNDRLGLYGGGLVREIRCAHDGDAIAGAIAALDDQQTDLTVVFGASAIVDRRDEVPSGIEAAGGKVLHFGMPVDPGNLLLLGERGGRPVLGAPGCARSPKENGFDWVLDRIAAGIPVTGADLTGMGVGGLLMEIPSRPQPRAGRTARRDRARIGAVILAAGRSTRMDGTHKLLEPIAGAPLVRRAAQAALASSAGPVVVVTGHRADEVRDVLSGLDLSFAHNPDYAEGLSTSLACGIAAMPEDVDGAVVCLADMPGVDAALIDRLAQTFRDAPEGAIVVPTLGGKRGNPVVWARRYFPALGRITGDVGGRALIGENAARVVEVPVDGDAVLADVDTPETLDAARKRYGGEGA